MFTYGVPSTHLPSACGTKAEIQEMSSRRTQASYLALFKLSHMHMENHKAKWNQKVGEHEPYTSEQLGNSLVISPVPCYTDRSNLGNLSHSVMARRGKCNLVSRLPGKSTFPLAFSWRKSGQLFWQLKECSAQ